LSDFEVQNVEPSNERVTSIASSPLKSFHSSALTVTVKLFTLTLFSFASNFPFIRILESGVLTTVCSVSTAVVEIENLGFLI
jgi:hypothetical protein